MKKSLFIIAAAALVVSCANNDVRNEVVQSEKPIGFTKVYIEKGTKAITPGAYTTGNFETKGNSFGVFGFKTTDTQTDARVFNNVRVEYQDGLTVSTNGYEATTDWAYSPLVYWDKTATAYNFFAYAPSDADFTGTATLTSQDPTKFKIAGFEQATTQNAMIDLMTDLTSKNGDNKITGTYIGKNDVAFTFGHILSNINVAMAISPALKDDETDNPVKVLAVSLSGKIDNKGGYEYSSDAYKWTTTAATTSLTFSATQSGTSDDQYVFASKALKASDVAFTDVPALTDLLFVPQAVDDDFAIYVKYKIKDEIFESTIALKDFKNTSDAALSSWENGKQYTYRIVIGPEPILFDVAAVSSWVDGGVYTYTIE